MVYVARQSGLSETLVCLETALPAKFEETMEEALGFIPERPAGYENIEQKPKQVQRVGNNADEVKAIIDKNG